METQNNHQTAAFTANVEKEANPNHKSNKKIESHATISWFQIDTTHLYAPRYERKRKRGPQKGGGNEKEERGEA